MDSGKIVLASLFCVVLLQMCAVFPLVKEPHFSVKLPEIAPLIDFQFSASKYPMNYYVADLQERFSRSNVEESNVFLRASNRRDYNAELLDFRVLARKTYDRKWHTKLAEYWNFDKQHLSQVFDSCIDFADNTLYLNSTGKEIGFKNGSFTQYPSLTVYNTMTDSSKLSRLLGRRHIRMKKHAYVLMGDSFGAMRMWDGLVESFSSDSVNRMVLSSFAWMMQIVSFFTMDTFYIQPRYILSKKTNLLPGFVSFMHETTHLLSQRFSRDSSVIHFHSTPICADRLLLITTSPHKSYKLPQWPSFLLYRELIYIELKKYEQAIAHGYVPSQGRVSLKAYWSVMVNNSTFWQSRLGNGALVDTALSTLNMSRRKLNFTGEGVLETIRLLTKTDALVQPLTDDVLYTLFLKPGTFVVLLVSEMDRLSGMFSFVTQLLKNTFLGMVVHSLRQYDAYVERVKVNDSLPPSLLSSLLNSTSSTQMCGLEMSKKWWKKNTTEVVNYVHCCQLVLDISSAVNQTLNSHYRR